MVRGRCAPTIYQSLIEIEHQDVFGLLGLGSNCLGNYEQLLAGCAAVNVVLDLNQIKSYGSQKEKWHQQMFGKACLFFLTKQALTQPPESIFYEHAQEIIQVNFQTTQYNIQARMEPEPSADPFAGLSMLPQTQPPTSAINQQLEPAQQSPKMSKSQLKKLRNKQKWQEAKKIKKIQKKEAKKLKLKEKAENKQQHFDKQKKEYITQRKRKEQYVEKVQQGLRVVIDLQFFQQMVQKQRNSLFKQLTHCHSSNRRMPKACNLIISSTSPQVHEILTKKYNAHNWGITLQQKNICEAFPIETLVYLTGDAQTQIDTLQPKLNIFKFSKVYIIGGLVDHNRLKKITYNYALEHKIPMARFPLDKYVDLKSNCHLAVNHVYDIILRVYNGQGWEQAIKEAIPQRKIMEAEEKPKQ